MGASLPFTFGPPTPGVERLPKGAYCVRKADFWGNGPFPPGAFAGPAPHGVSGGSPIPPPRAFRGGFRPRARAACKAAEASAAFAVLAAASITNGRFG